MVTQIIRQDEINKTTAVCFIALGSNLQHPTKQLQQALQHLAELPHTSVRQVSQFYSFKAVGPGNQPDYLNAVAELHTQLTPLALLHALQYIEQQQGRIRTVKWGPRTLDLDILLYGDVVLNTPQLTIPHPHMRERDFVLIPLREIAPELTARLTANVLVP
ncbi:MAG: 2-amino-4-hydroxy-6-hydroxymethyldihydropteridine diphosphokinase [Gammaproteobacteria bacterium]